MPLVAVVKADAYGHGAIEVARTVLDAGAASLAVALVEEGRELRNSGITAPIHVLAEPPPAAAGQVVELDLIQTICTREMARALDQAAGSAGRRATVHLKVDTGMHRIGVSIEDAVAMAKVIDAAVNLDLEGTFTHLATADEATGEFAEVQLERFAAALAAIRDSGVDPGVTHAANSAALISRPAARLDLARAGIAIYGLRPASDFELPSGLELTPAMALKARISQVREIDADEGVSYGLTYRAPAPTRIGTIPIGYADGYPRGLSNLAEVLVRGVRCRVVGTVTMDQTLVDLGGIEAEVGDEVVLLGSQSDGAVTADELAGYLGTISYEIVSRIGPRVPRVYI